MKRVPIPLLLSAGAVLACSDRSPTVSSPTFNINNPPAGARSVTVMSQNLYVGADVDAVLLALQSPDPNDDVPALLTAVQTFENTDFPARAAAIADEIARARPHAVGLQEVSNVDITLPPLGIDLHQQFLPILLDALSSRGLHYRVVAEMQGAVAEQLGGAIRLVDNDALLVDDRVTVLSAGGQNFSLNVGPVADGVNLVRSFVWARTTIGGTDYTIVSAHPESDLGGNTFGPLRAAQVAEIVGFVGADPRVVVMGDLNDDPGTAMYDVFTGAGFNDTWAALHPGAQGFTCCQRGDLSNPVATFDQRIDYIWTRGFGGNITGSIDRFGNVPADRLAGPAYPIWPSDHAGLLAALK